VSDVGKETFESILNMLESYPGWHNVSQWIETQDVYYNIDLPSGIDGVKNVRTQVRTSVGLDSEKKMFLQHSVKKKLSSVDMDAVSLGSCVSGCLPVAREKLKGPVGVRVGIAVEQHVPNELLPIAVVPTMVRIKQRKRFALNSLGVDGAVFCVDTTIVFSGCSKSEAEQKQASSQYASYEVEVECLDPRAYLQSCNQQESMLALSILLKLHDFLAFLNPHTSVTLSPVVS